MHIKRHILRVPEFQVCILMGLFITMVLVSCNLTNREMLPSPFTPSTKDYNHYPAGSSKGKFPCLTSIKLEENQRIAPLMYSVIRRIKKDEKVVILDKGGTNKALDTQSRDTANKNLKTSFSDHMASSYKRGMAYYNGLYGGDKNLSLAIKHLGLAAKVGHVESIHTLGYIYKYEGSIKDGELAEKFLKDSADKGHATSQYELALLYEEKGQINLTFTYFEKAALNGHIESQCNVGSMYSQGYGVDKNDAFAIDFWKKAADQKCPEAQYELGMALGKGGYGMVQNKILSKKYLTASADQGHVEAQHQLSLMEKESKNEIILQQDDEKGRYESHKKMWRETVRDEKALYKLGMLFYGHGIMIDKKIGLRDLELLARTGNLPALCTLGNLYTRGVEGNDDLDFMMDCVQVAIACGDVAVKCQVGTWYAEMEQCNLDDLFELDCVQTAARGGDIIAQCKLGQYYATKDTWDQDKRLVWDCIQTAAKHGEVMSQYRLGLIYYEGLYGVKKNNKMAFKWLKKSADQGNRDAKYFVANMCILGQGTSRNDPLSQYYLEQVVQGRNQSVKGDIFCGGGRIKGVKKLGVDYQMGIN